MDIRRTERRDAPIDAAGASPSSPAALFQVRSAEPAAAVAAVAGPLARLRGGAIDRAGYVEEHIERATEHLQGLGAEMVEHVRQALREACGSSPLLLDLIAHASS
jgi:hypothetical protein